MSHKITTKSDVRRILDDYDYFVFDCDGVLWLGDHLLPYVAETLALLRENDKTIVFVTNNSTKSRNAYLKKFESFGISGLSRDDVFGSLYASAVYIDKILQLPKDKKVFVLGEKGIEEELQELGYETLGGSDYRLEADGVTFDPGHELLENLDDSVGAVLAGLTLNLNYLKLSLALQYLLKDNKSIPFIATNIDSTFPLKGKILIGAGSIIESVAYASGRKPDAVCGKPSQAMMETIKAKYEELGRAPHKGLMIGDRLNTDMKFGKEGGLDTLLVLTGIENEETVRSLKGKSAPTFYADRLGDLYLIN